MDHNPPRPQFMVSIHMPQGVGPTGYVLSTLDGRPPEDDSRNVIHPTERVDNPFALDP